MVNGTTKLTGEDRRFQGSLLEEIRSLMCDGMGRTPEEIQSLLAERGITASTQSITARLRDLRLAKHGGFLVELRRRPGIGRLFEYLVTEEPSSPEESGARLMEDFTGLLGEDF